jgi:hypothetical protein
MQNENIEKDKLSKISEIFDSNIDKTSIKFNEDIEQLYNKEENFHIFLKNFGNLEDNNINIFNDINHILYESEIKNVEHSKKIIENIETMVRYNYDIKNIDNFNFKDYSFFIIQDKIIKRKKDLKFIKNLNFKSVKENEYKKGVIEYLNLKSLLDNIDNINENFLDIIEKKIIKKKKENPVFSLITENDNEIQEIFNKNNVVDKLKLIESYLKINKNPDINLIKTFLNDIAKLIKNKYNVDNETIKKFNNIVEQLNLKNEFKTTSYEEDTYMEMQYNIQRKKED